MYLKHYISNLKKEYQNVFFSGIESDSSKIKKNFIFFAIKGNNNDGHHFIGEAIKRGAKIVIHEKNFSVICGFLKIKKIENFDFSKSTENALNVILRQK